jgi:hypothetical protein
MHESERGNEHTHPDNFGSVFRKPNNHRLNSRNKEMLWFQAIHLLSGKGDERPNQVSAAYDLLLRQKGGL